MFNPSIFKSREGNCPQFFRPWSGISEVRTTDSYGASDFMSIRSFSGVCVAQSSVLFHKNKWVLTSKGDNSAEKLHNPTSDFSIFDCLHYRLRTTFIGN
jgi:hypothetical protein